MKQIETVHQAFCIKHVLILNFFFKSNKTIFSSKQFVNTIFINQKKMFYYKKGNRTIADLRHGGNDIISPSTLIFGPIKG